MEGRGFIQAVWTSLIERREVVGSDWCCQMLGQLRSTARLPYLELLIEKISFGWLGFLLALITCRRIMISQNATHVTPTATTTAPGQFLSTIRVF
jgi:hypothetical protein